MNATATPTPVPEAHAVRPRQVEQLEGLQALRAIAALMVVVTHAALTTAGASALLYAGETGVDVFFVISGFVMAWTTHRESGQVTSVSTKASDARVFIVRRLERILPLYYLALLWTARRDLMHGQFSAALVKDFFFIPHVSIEDAHRIVPTLPQGWTLNYEMFFYALVALALLISKRRALLLLPILPAIVAAGMLTPFCDFTTPDHLFDWRGDPHSVVGLLLHVYTNNIVLEFGYGILLAWCVRRFTAPVWPRWAFYACAGAGFACLVAGHNLWPRGLWQGLPAAVIVWSSIHALRGRRMYVVELLGAASYAIYLFHWTTFGLTKPLMTHLGATEGHPGRIALVIGADIALAIAAGVAIHVILEKPLMRFFKRSRHGREARSALVRPSSRAHPDSAAP